jgi:hypothetical protein
MKKLLKRAALALVLLASLAGCFVYGQFRQAAFDQAALDARGDEITLTGVQCDGGLVSAIRVAVPHEGTVVLAIDNHLCDGKNHGDV